MYDERDIRAAGRAFAELELGLDDVVDVQLPPYRDIPELLGRWEQRESELTARARLCSCGAQGPYWGGWRRYNTRTGYVHHVPALRRGSLPAVHRPPAGRPLRVAAPARHTGRRLPVPVVQGEPCDGVGSLPRARLFARASLRQLQRLQGEEFPGQLLGAAGGGRAALAGVPRLPGTADPARPVPRRHRPEASGGDRAPPPPRPPMATPDVGPSRGTRPRRSSSRSTASACSGPGSTRRSSASSPARCRITRRQALISAGESGAFWTARRARRVPTCASKVLLGWLRSPRSDR